LNDSIAEKIKKLLRLAADKSNRHEAELALRRALELARKHQIDVESLDLDEKTERILHEQFPFTKRMSYLQYRSLNILCNFFRVNVVRGYAKVTLIGKPTDIAIAWYAYEFIVRVGNRELQAFEIAEKKARRKMSTGKRQSFIQGYIYGLAKQLNAAEADITLTDDQTALVVAEEAQRESYEASLFLETRTLSRDVARKNSTALILGFCAGQSTSIRTPLDPAPTAPILAIE